MAVFDFLKNKQNKQKPAGAPGFRLKNSKKATRPLDSQEIKDKTAKEAAGVAVKNKDGEKNVNKTAYRILMAPIITEKSTDQGEVNQYVFKVAPDSVKNEIKKAVEMTYSVNVEAVNVISIPRKKRRVGRHIGWRQGYKKAVVTIRKGQKIEIVVR